MSEFPTTPEAVLKLAKWAKEQTGDPSPFANRAQLFASYLVTQCGANPHPLRLLLHPVWPEAAAAVWMERHDQQHQFARWCIMQYSYRKIVIHHLETVAAGAELPKHLVAPLLEEWDALNYPEQLPEAIRTRALERNRRALALFPHLEPSA